MTSAEVKGMCRRMKICFDEDHPDHISEEKIRELYPPFMEYFLVDKPVNADGKRYIDIKELTIRIYSDLEVAEEEQTVQTVLEEEELRWKRSCEYLEGLGLWAIIYRLEV